MDAILHGKMNRRTKAVLIFNPSSGASVQSPVQLMDVIREMQALNFTPEAYLVGPDFDMEKVVKDSIAHGFRMFVVSGGDGTVSLAARMLAGTRATLGIIPTGTQNNTALSLGIPHDIPSAVAILRNGRQIKVDVGLLSCGKVKTSFLEVCSVGLVSALFPSADDIQHGNLARVGDFITSLVGSPSAEIRLVLDGKQEIRKTGYVVLVSNMPYIGFHYKVGSDTSHLDGLLDVQFFADLTKLDLLGYVVQGVGVDNPGDPRIQHFHVRKVEIDTQPAMPVMADGTAFGEGRVSIKVKRRALAVMVGTSVTDQSEEAEVFVE